MGSSNNDGKRVSQRKHVLYSDLDQQRFRTAICVEVFRWCRFAPRTDASAERLAAVFKAIEKGDRAETLSVLRRWGILGRYTVDSPVREASLSPGTVWDFDLCAWTDPERPGH